MTALTPDDRRRIAEDTEGIRERPDWVPVSAAQCLTAPAPSIRDATTGNETPRWRGPDTPEKQLETLRVSSAEALLAEHRHP